MRHEVSLELIETKEHQAECGHDSKGDIEDIIFKDVADKAGSKGKNTNRKDHYASGRN